VSKTHLAQNGYFTAVQFYFDAAHTSFNHTGTLGPMNLIVKQSSQGETINSPFVPPNNEFWVATGYGVTTDGQATLYNVQFPGWSVCKKPNPYTGQYYYQVCIVKEGADG
jgi:hypothetical protein